MFIYIAKNVAEKKYQCFSGWVIFYQHGSKTFVNLFFEKPCIRTKNCTLFHSEEHFSRPSRGTLFENPNNWVVGRTRFWWRNINRWDILLGDPNHACPVVSKVDVPNLVTFLNRRHVFEWDVVWCGSKKKHQKSLCLKGLDYVLKIW